MVSLVISWMTYYGVFIFLNFFEAKTKNLIQENAGDII